MIDYKQTTKDKIEIAVTDWAQDIWFFITKKAQKVQSFFFRVLVYNTQRINRGFSDRDAWNGDTHIAGTIAGLLRWYTSPLNHGVAMSYADPLDSTDNVNLMAKRRDEDYERIADIFSRYHKSKYDDSVTDEEINEALDWLKIHFRELWY
jgi:hypothetical protein